MEAAVRGWLVVRVVGAVRALWVEGGRQGLKWRWLGRTRWQTEKPVLGMVDGWSVRGEEPV